MEYKLEIFDMDKGEWYAIKESDDVSYLLVYLKLYKKNYPENYYRVIKLLRLL